MRLKVASVRGLTERANGLFPPIGLVPQSLAEIEPASRLTAAPGLRQLRFTFALASRPAEQEESQIVARLLEPRGQSGLKRRLRFRPAFFLRRVSAVMQ